MFCIISNTSNNNMLSSEHFHKFYIPAYDTATYRKSKSLIYYDGL